MIGVYGTSHVSKDSIEVINEVMDRDPDIIALELDDKRLYALKNGKQSNPDTFFLKLLQKVQNRIGKKTGLMPGREMLYAYERARDEEKTVALIDRDISVTLHHLKSISRKEKFKATASLLLALLLPFGRMDASEIPEDEKIDEMVETLQRSYPCFYRVLMEERNELMALKLAELQERNPEAHIVAFVGAAHKKPIKNILRAEGYAVGSQSSLADFQ